MRSAAPCCSTERKNSFFCDDVEECLITQNPDDATAIIELIVTWLVQLNVHPESTSRGYI